MRVFISSTVYDLIDVRAELAEQLRTLGITPVLSDDKLSDFRVQHDVNSIETCLVNVDSCDEVILILDKRYSATLEKFGYGEFSATHLEYKRAIEKNIPVRVYLRDHLLADYTIWKRNGKHHSKIMTWVSEKDIGLFKFLDEHTPLETDAKTSNWYYTFTNSIDLKAAITKHFEERMLPERLTQAIQNNNFPLIDIELEVVDNGNHYGEKSFTVYLTNIGGAPAFNLSSYWEKDEDKKTICDIIEQSSKLFNTARQIEGKTLRDILARHQSFSKPLLVKFNSTKSIEKYLIVKYDSLIGISVTAKFVVSSRFDEKGTFFKKATLIERKFRRSSEKTLITIEDD